MEEDEPDMYPEDDMSVISSGADRVRSPPPLSRPPSSAARPDPEDNTPIAEDMVPEVARLPDEFQEPRRKAAASPGEGATSNGAANSEPSRGRKSGKGKGKGKEKEKEITSEESADSRTSSRLADTLTSVWGKELSPGPTRQAAGTPPADIEGAQEQRVEAAFEAPPATQTPRAEEVEPSQQATAPHTPGIDTTTTPPLEPIVAADAAEIPAAQEPEPERTESPKLDEPAPSIPPAPKGTTQELDTPTAPPAVAQDVARLSTRPSSPFVTEQQKDINPEGIALPPSPADQTEEVEATIDHADDRQETTKADDAPEAGKSAKSSKRPTPLASPAVVAQSLADLTGMHFTPSPHHLLLPEQIALPLSTASSPKSSVCHTPHRSPLPLFDNTVLPAELVGTVPQRSRPTSMVVSPSFKVIDVGALNDDGNFVPAQTRRRSHTATPKRSRQPSKTASPAAKVAEIASETEERSGQHTPARREDEGLFGSWEAF